MNDLSDFLHRTYKRERRRLHEKEWPPNQPSLIVNLALIHYKNIRTQEELIAVSKRSKEGASHIENLMASHSNVTTDIKKLFIPEISGESPKRILIEGAPGIGKTILAKEIAYQWANGQILKECKLLFLLCLRDPKVHEIKSVDEILKFFASENTPDLKRYIENSYGQNVAFVFDGFDEYPSSLREKSFITYLIKGVNCGRILDSTVIVTSRPTATLNLHRLVDRRIEILGFPKEEREKYVLSYLNNLYGDHSCNKKEELDIYLKKYPIINNLCYIPLHLSILMYLFQEDSLPETLTEMNEYFIFHTIYRYLEINKLTLPSEVKKLEDLPRDIIKFVYKLSQLAFKGLQDNQLVFTLNEIKKICPTVDSMPWPGVINGFGLLQAVQHHPKGAPGETTSVNFLHFTMQEYFAALHVSRLPSEQQLLLMNKTFWDGQFNFMWMMYVGIVGVKSSAFASFTKASDLSNSTVSMTFANKIKYLHLFHCCMEAKSNPEIMLKKPVSSIFTDGKIILNSITLLPHHISSLIFFMSASCKKQKWRVLELDDCKLRDIGMNSLLEHFIKNDESISTLEYVDLSGNYSSPWGVYCAIIRHCCICSLILCGDEGMERYVTEITAVLKTNVTLQSLTLCKIKRFAVQLIKQILVGNTTLKELHLSWGNNAKGITLLTREYKPIPHNKRVITFNILYDGDCKGLPEVICLSTNNINDNESYLISFGLCNNTTVKTLDLSHNNISVSGMNRLSECIKHAVLLKYVDLSGNKSSPWGVYCTIIRYCCVNSLTLCGDEGMRGFVKEITDSLENNKMLHSLTLFTTRNRYIVVDANNAYKIHNVVVAVGKLKFNTLISKDKNVTSPSINRKTVDIRVFLYDGHWKCSLETIILSNQDINDDIVCLISFGLYRNITIKKLDLSHNNISTNGMIRLSECIKHAVALEYIDLSGNKSSPWGVYTNVIRYCCVHSLTLCGDEGMDECIQDITYSLQNNKILQLLTLCESGRIGLQSIVNNTTTKEFNLSYNLIWGNNLKGTKIFCRKLSHTSHNNNGLINVNILYADGDPNRTKIFCQKLSHTSHNNRLININILCDGDGDYSPETICFSNRAIDDNKVCLISFGFYNNTTVKKLDLSHNDISDNGMIRLSECIKHAVELEYIDLSGNKSSPWGVYCAIIKHCCVKSLTLYGDKGMKEYTEKIKEGLQGEKLQSLTLHKIGRIGLESIKDVLSEKTSLKELNMSWKSKGTTIIHRKFKHCGSSSHKVDINILYDNHDCSVKVINMSNQDIDDDAVHLIAFGLYDNRTVTKLDLSSNGITHIGMKELLKCIKHPVPLEYVDLSKNKSSPWDVYCAIIEYCCVNSLTLCGDEGMNDTHVEKIVNYLQTNTILQSLTLCKIGEIGLESIKDVLTKIKNASLKELNMSWKSKGTTIIHRKLTNNELSSTKLGKYEEVDINILYDNDHECSSEAIIMSNKGIDNDKVSLISFGLYDNKKIKKLDLSYNNISVNGMNRLLECIKDAMLLEYVDLSGNKSSPWGMYCSIIEHCHVNSLTLCGEKGLKEYVMKITDSLQKNRRLQSLTLCVFKNNMRMQKDIVVTKNCLVLNEKLFLHSDDRVVNIKILYYDDDDNEHLPETICLKNINDDTVCLISFGLYYNTTIKRLDLSHNKISAFGMIMLSDSVKHSIPLEYVDRSGNNSSPWGDSVIPLEYVDLSGNNSSPWGVYCAIIKNSSVTSLTLCGDEGMEEYFKAITNSLQKTTLQSLTLISNMGKHEDMVVKNKQQVLVLSGKMNINVNNSSVIINIKMLCYDDETECSPETVSLSNKNIKDDTVCLISFGLYNNTAIKKLDMSHNNIGINGMNRLLKHIKHPIPLEYVDLSGNKSSPWGVYCAVIKHCCAKRLTLCGDKGIKKYVKEITDSIQMNNTLQSLTVCVSRYKRKGIVIKTNNRKSLYIHGALFVTRNLNSNDKDRWMNVYVLYDDDNEHLPETVSLSNKDIDDDTVCLISFGLYNNKTVKKLDLSHNNIGVNGMKRLSECIIHATPLYLGYVDLSGNESSPWDVYCAIIRYCCVNSLTLCGGVLLKDYVKEMTDSLQTNKSLQSLMITGSPQLNPKVELLILCKTGRIETDLIENISVNNTTSNKFNLSKENYAERIKILIRELNPISHKHLPGYNDDTGNLIVFGINELIISPILSRINLSPWDTYCEIIRDCSVNSLMLCGDKGMNKYFKKIINSLQTNTTIQSLTLYASIHRSSTGRYMDRNQNILFGKIFLVSKRVVNVKVLYDEYLTVTKNIKCSSEVINMSNQNIDDDTVCLITFGLFNNTSIQILDLSCNNITDDGTVAISDCLKNNYCLRTLILSSNSISYKGAQKISEIVRVNKEIKKIDMSYNNICDDGAIAISKSLKVNNTLQELNLSDNQITSVGVKKIAKALWINKGLHKLDISQNTVGDGVIYLSDSLKINNTLIELNLSKTSVSGEGAKIIGEAIQMNSALQKFVLSA